MAGHQDEIRFLREKAAEFRELARRYPAAPQILAIAMELENRVSDLELGRINDCGFGER